MNPAARCLLLLAALAGLAGCASTSPHATASSASTFQPENFVGEVVLPRSVRRVLLLPVHGGEYAPAEVCEYLDPIFATALEHQMRFEVVVLTREECAKSFGTPDLASTDALPRDFLQKLGSEYAAQAVLFVDITAFDAYRPLTFGIRAKLATVSDRRLIWSFDEVYSTLDPRIANSLRRFYTKNGQMGSPVDLSTDALVSPRRFAAYVAATTFATLPRR